MNGFHGSFSDRGTFVLAQDAASRRPEPHLGCEVVVRGHLAGRAALRSRFGLSAAGGASDAALIAHAFRTWGADLQAHVLGEYAAVVWDTRAKTGLLTHDALGLQALFYARRAGGVAFATELVELIDAETSALLDEEYVADYLACGSITGERTPYPSIRRLLPGQSLWWSGDELRAMRTWNLADVAPLRCRDDAEYEERFRALLEAGVHAALDTSGRAGIALSGGLDSSTVACVAAAAGYDIAAYSTICPRWPEVDERRWMREVVDRYALPWHTHDIEAALPFSRLPTEFLGEPTSSVIDEERTRIHYESVASHGVTVMLTGDGGDTVLCTSPGTRPVHLADPLFDGDPLRAIRAAADWKRHSPEIRSLTYWLLRGLVDPAADHLRGNRIRAERVQFPVWFASGYAAGMELERRARRRIAPACRRPGNQAVWDDLYAGSLALTTLPRGRMPYDVRTPLLYRPLVEFMWSIPWEQKLRPRCDRYLQRRALAGVLPEPIRRRASKAGGTAPFVDGLGRSRDWIAYLTDSPMMAERGIVDAARWRHAVAQASVGQTNSDRYFFAGVAVEVWLKQLSAHRAEMLRARPLASAV